MSLWIPRLEWDFQTINATQNATNVLSGISSTAEINVGMIVDVTGVPSGATVISKTVNSVTLSENATLSGTFATIFHERYDFEYPPVKDSEEILKPKQNILESLNGSQQRQTLFLEAVRNLEFWFVNQVDADKLLYTFYMYAYKGNQFLYYQDKAIASSVSYELENSSFARARQIKKHPNFKYSIAYSFRRVVE